MLTTLCWSKWESSSSTSAVEPAPQGLRHSIVEVRRAGWEGEGKGNNIGFKLILNEWFQPEKLIDLADFPVSWPRAHFQVRFACPAPAVWSIQPWWASQQQQAPARLWPSVCCSIYWELGRTSREEQASPVNWSRVFPRQQQTPLMWVPFTFVR